MSGQSIECPRCKANGVLRGQCDLKRRPVKGTGIVVDWCPRCEGLWFDGGELERSFADADQQMERPSDALAGSLDCPKGHGPMWTFRYPGTLATIDMCGECSGVWLEAGLFQEIKVVRAHLTAEEEKRRAEGVRGRICDWIDRKIDELTQE